MRKKKILIIEDYDTLGNIYEQHFNATGYKAKWVDSIKGAVKAAKSFKADLLLVDHGLGGGENGVDSIPKLRKLFPKAILIIFSNYSSFLLEDKAMEGGADDFWPKVDISLPELNRRIDALLD